MVVFPVSFLGVGLSAIEAGGAVREFHESIPLSHYCGVRRSHCASSSELSW